MVHLRRWEFGRKMWAQDKGKGRGKERFASHQPLVVVKCTVVQLYVTLPGENGACEKIKSQ